MTFTGDLPEDFAPSASEQKQARMEDSSGTGAVKDTKPWRFDLVPMRVIKKLAIHFGRGVAAGYESRNWEKGQKYSVYLTSALSHITEFMEGEDFDPDEATIIVMPDGSELPAHHLDAAIWQLVCLRDHTLNPELVARHGLDDRR